MIIVLSETSWHRFCIQKASLVRRQASGTIWLVRASGLDPFKTQMRLRRILTCSFLQLVVRGPDEKSKKTAIRYDTVITYIRVDVDDKFCVRSIALEYLIASAVMDCCVKSVEQQGKRIW